MSANPLLKTRRGYLSIGDLEEFANITVTDDDEALDQIQMAEELIDSYVGPQLTFWPKDSSHIGHVSSATSTTLVDDTSTTFLSYNDGYFVGLEVEIIGGTGAGQKRTVTDSDADSLTLTFSAAWSTIPDTTSIWSIVQVGKFPRYQDVRVDPVTNRHYKTIPEAISRAVAAQVSYMISMGAEFFSSDASDKNSETIGNYSYSKGGSGGSGGMSADAKLVSPRVRGLLRGFVNRTGILKVSNPTNL